MEKGENKVKLNVYTGFSDIEEVVNFQREIGAFDQVEVPAYVLDIEKEYDKEMESSGYVLEQAGYDQFTSKWARVHEWASHQLAKAEYLAGAIETGMREIVTAKRPLVPKNHCGSLKAQERWIEASSPVFQNLVKMQPKALAYLKFFENKKDVVKINHYLCKSMSRSIDGDKTIQGHP